jgi:hypothetical protein
MESVNLLMHACASSDNLCNGHAMRPHMTIDYYSNTNEAAKSKGRPVVALPVLLFDEYYHVKSLKKKKGSESKKRSAYKHTCKKSESQL